MNNVIMSISTGKQLKRINKKQARSLYNNGIDIMIIPNKCSPNNLWFIGIWYNVNISGSDFDKLVNEFEYYNCNYAELGKYAAYYIQS